MNRRRLPTGLQVRDGRYYYEVRHERLRGGRMTLSLRTRDFDLAVARRQSIVTLMERGDWAVIERLRKGELHITDVQAAVREGEVRKLRRQGHGATMLGDAVDQFLQRTEATASDATYKAYRAACRKLLDEFGRDFPMEDMTIQRAEQFMHGPKETATGETWAANTQRSNRTLYGSLWRLAIEREAEAAERARLEPRLTLNPWASVRVPEWRQTRVVFLSPEEWLHGVEVWRGSPHLGLLTLAYRAGLRKQEAIYTRTDVDVLLDGPEPMVRVQSRGGEHPWKPKTENSERDVPLTPDAVELLREHRKRFAGERYFIRPHHEDKPIGLSTADHWTRDAYVAAGIKYGRQGDGLTLHSGRHTYASWLAQAEVPLNIVADLLGDTLEMVDKTYAHLVPTTLRSAAMKGYEMLRAANDTPTPPTDAR